MDQRIAKGEETKLKIMESAMHIASVEGLKGLSAKKIADHAGVSKSNVFHHFASVEDITTMMIKGLCQSMTRALEDRTFINLEEFLVIMGQSTFDLSDHELVYYRVLFSFYNDAVFHDRYKDQLLTVKREFSIYLCEMIKKIEGVDLPYEVGEMITMELDGMGLHYLIERDSVKYKKIWKMKVKQYLHLIQTI